MRVAQNSFSEIEGVQCHPAIRGDLVTQILAKFCVNDRVALV
jgi:hypothetical protein